MEEKFVNESSATFRKLFQKSFGFTIQTLVWNEKKVFLQNQKNILDKIVELYLS